MTDKNKEVIEKLNFDDLLEDLGAEVSPKRDFRSLGKPEPGVKEDSKEEKKETSSQNVSPEVQSSNGRYASRILGEPQQEPMADDDNFDTVSISSNMSIVSASGKRKKISLGNQLSKAYNTYHTKTKRGRNRSKFNKLKKECISLAKKGKPCMILYAPLPKGVVNLFSKEGVRYTELRTSIGRQYELRWAEDS